MTTSEYDTKNYVFSWTNDKALKIKYVGRFLNNPSVLEEMITIGVTSYKLNGEIIGIKIDNFENVCKSHAAGLLSQNVLSCFRHTFKSGEDQREQLLRGLQYFSLILHYKLLGASDVNETKLGVLRKDYQNILEKIPEHNKSLQNAEAKALEYHLQEPLVASTGFMAYPTLKYTWLISETEEKHETLPEYLHVVDTRFNESGTILTEVYKDRQSECIKAIMDMQQRKYGISYEDLIRLRNENNKLHKIISELELVLKVPKEETLYFKEQSLEDEKENKEDLDRELHKLNLMYAQET